MAKSISVGARRRLRSSRGVIDLASVMVGVIVLGIVASISTVSVIGVLSFSSDATAKGDISIARTSELAVRIASREFLPTSALVTAGYPQPPTLAVSTDANRTCYVSVSASKTGTVYYGTSQDKSVTELVDPTTPGCLTSTSVKALAKSVCVAALGSAGACTKWD